MKPFSLILILFLFACSSGEKAFKDPFEGLMVAIPAGTFEMGCKESDGKCQDKEKPVHKVTVSAVKMLKHEVTQAQWVAVMGGKSPAFFKNCDDCPIEWVTRPEIQQFLQTLNQKSGKIYRLPTEAEWEYAARAGEETPYSGGANLEEVAWYKVNSAEKTHPVMQKKPNKFGLYDIGRNVSEWCLDYYESAFYRKSEENNPVNKTASPYYIMRGGSWMSGDGACRSAWRGWISGQSNNYDVGFRLVL